MTFKTLLTCIEHSFIQLCFSKEKEEGWFQTSSLLALLPLCRMIITCHFRVTALSGQAALAFSQRGIASKLNKINSLQSAALSKAGRLLVDWHVSAYRLVFPLWHVVCLCSCANITVIRWQCIERIESSGGNALSSGNALSELPPQVAMH